MSSSRSRQGTEAQFAALVDALQLDPEVARGHVKTASAKIKFRRFWDRVVPTLNSLGGATKTNKQWMKYWSDKKSIIKKKAAERAAARRRTGGGVEYVRELTETEERVLQLLGGEGYAVGDSHLRYELIQRSRSSELTATVTPPASPSILPHLPHIIEPVSPILQQSPLPVPATEEEEERRYSTTQTLPSPRQPGPELGLSPRHLSRPDVSANLIREGRTTSRQPPSQRRSQITSISERFLRIEERRLALEEKQANTNLIAAQALRDMAAAVRCLGDGNRAMADAIRDGFCSIRDIADKFYT